jgi:hypothetical protein
MAEEGYYIFYTNLYKRALPLLRLIWILNTLLSVVELPKILHVS